MNSDANDETNFPQKLILTNRQVSSLYVRLFQIICLLI